MHNSSHSNKWTFPFEINQARNIPLKSRSQINYLTFSWQLCNVHNEHAHSTIIQQYTECLSQLKSLLPKSNSSNRKRSMYRLHEMHRRLCNYGAIQITAQLKSQSLLCQRSDYICIYVMLPLRLQWVADMHLFIPTEANSACICQIVEVQLPPILLLTCRYTQTEDLRSIDRVRVVVAKAETASCLIASDL